MDNVPTEGAGAEPAEEGLTITLPKRPQPGDVLRAFDAVMCSMDDPDMRASLLCSYFAMVTTNSYLKENTDPVVAIEDAGQEIGAMMGARVLRYMLAHLQVTAEKQRRTLKPSENVTTDQEGDSYEDDDRFLLGILVGLLRESVPVDPDHGSAMVRSRRFGLMASAVSTLIVGIGANVARSGGEPDDGNPIGIMTTAMSAARRGLEGCRVGMDVATLFGVQAKPERSTVLRSASKCVQREIALRERVYPIQVGKGRITQSTADRELKGMRQTAELLEELGAVLWGYAVERAPAEQSMRKLVTLFGTLKDPG